MEITTLDFEMMMVGASMLIGAVIISVTWTKIYFWRRERQKLKEKGGEKNNV